MKKGLLLTAAGVVATMFGIRTLLKKNDADIEDVVDTFDDEDDDYYLEDDTTEE